MQPVAFSPDRPSLPLVTKFGTKWAITRSGLVADAMSALKTLAVYNSLRLIWVPGHCGIAGNEKADALAKQASASYFTGPEPSVGISVSTIYSFINEWTVHEQNRMWQEPSGCRLSTSCTELTLHELGMLSDFPGRIYGS